MQCANPECGKTRATGFFGRGYKQEGYTHEGSWYCDQACHRATMLHDYFMRKRTGREMHTISWPVTSRSFGAALVQMGKIEGYQLEQAIEEKSANGKQPLAHYLLKKGLIKRKDVIEALGKVHRVPVVFLRDRVIEQETMELIPAEVALLSGVLPLNFNRKTNRLSLLMKDPSDLTTIITLRRLLKCDVQQFQGDPHEIDQYLAFYYGSVGQAERRAEQRRENESRFALAN